MLLHRRDEAVLLLRGHSSVKAADAERVRDA